MAPINYMHIWLVEFRIICAKSLLLHTFQKIFFETLGAPNYVHKEFTRCT
jgi:hypothetical protein